MARAREHLQKAPIVEALLDFRVLRQEQISAEIFASIGASIGAQYARNSSIQTMQARFGIAQGRLIEPWQSQTEIGRRYQTATEIAQFRVDGFTFSKIAPYTTWEEVSEEAFRLWRIYVDIAKPKQVSRVAVRYINRISVSSVQYLKEYLEAPPQLPAPVLHGIQDFLTRIHVRDDKRNASAVIVQALEPRIDPDAISVLLDIDAYREVNEAPDDPGLLQVFELLRQLKNEIFFASITEKAVELFL